MRGIRLAGVVILLAAAWMLAFNGPSELLKYYQGTEQIPAGLFQAYSDLVDSLERGKPEDIARHGLPHGLVVREAPRPNGWQEQGDDINLPFLRSGFSKHILSVRKEDDGCYLIRTATTALWFVETRSMGWRLYRWLDKPIQ